MQNSPQRRWIGLKSPELTARINPLGAQLSVLQDRSGRDLLWDGDPSVWAGRAPLLFPIVGALAGGHYRLGSRSYSLARHGFARGKLFDIVNTTSAAATFRLRADEATLQVYPFRFDLKVEFALQGETLSVMAGIRNGGDEAMPASFGYHPAFRWPLPYGQPRSSHFIEFAQDEPASIRRLDAEGLLTPTRHTTPVLGRRLGLRDDLFEHDALIFDELRSRAVIYGTEQGPRIEVCYPDAPYFGLWTKPGAGFICLEPWHGIADPQGFSADLSAKPGIFWVAPGAEFSITMSIALRANDPG
jgi:galactose mutarotase-like enzyme